MALPVVAGVDGSEPSLRAVEWAADEAALHGAPLRLVYASLWERYEGGSLAQDVGGPDERVTAEDIVRAAERRARGRQPAVPVVTEVLPGEPEYVLVRESRSALLMLLGCRGRSGLTEALLGSVGVAVAGHAHCPVIVLRGGRYDRARSGTGGRVVLGVGEEPADAAAVRFAVEEARLRGAALEAVRAWRRPAHTTTGHPLMTGEPAHVAERQAAQTLEEALRDVPDDLPVRRRTLEGRPRDVLLAAAHDADLLVVGVRRHPGHYGLQFGRVPHGVLHHAACPVAVVPEPA